LRGFDATAFVDGLRLALRTVFDGTAPDDVSIAFYYCVSATEFVGFVGIERGVNSAEDDISAAFAGFFADLVSAKRVGGVDADADDVAGLDLLDVYSLEGFVDENGVAVASRRGGRQNV
jgi:hypothetical protein